MVTKALELVVPALIVVGDINSLNLKLSPV